MSSVVLNGTTPVVRQRPVVGRKPTTPVAEAGMRIEPPVSVPRAIRADPSHRLTPAPADEPPGARCSSASHGLTGVPVCGFSPTAPKANSTVCVLPVNTAPNRRSARTRNPSRHGGSGRGVPARSGSPSSAYRSLTDTATPASGPGSSPRATAASTPRACRRAASASKAM